MGVIESGPVTVPLLSVESTVPDWVWTRTVPAHVSFAMGLPDVNGDVNVYAAPASNQVCWVKDVIATSAGPPRAVLARAGGCGAPPPTIEKLDATRNSW